MEHGQFDLHRLLAVVRRHRNWVYYFFCVSILLAVLFNLLPPTYEAKVTIRVKPVAKSLTDAAGSGWASEELARQKMYTYAELLRSRTVVEAAIAKFSADDPAPLTYEKAISQIRIRPLKDTEILEILVFDSSPANAQKLVNSLAVAFNERLLDIVRAESKDARVFIGERLADVKRDLDKAEKALIEYRKANQVVAINEQARTFVERQSNLRRLEAENRLLLEAARAKMKTPSIVVDTPVLQQYRQQIAMQEAELAGLMKTLTEEHPRVVQLQATITENRSKLQKELNRIAKGELALGETQRMTLQQISSQEEKELSQLPSTEIHLARLMLDYSVAEGVYTMLAKRYEESRISEVMESTNVQIFDMASLPEEPVKPRKTFNLVIAAFLGLFCGTLFTFVVEFFHKTIDTPDDMRDSLDLRLLGIIPQLRPKKRWKIWQFGTFQRVRYVIKDREQSPQAEAFRDFCTNLHDSVFSEKPLQAVLLASASAGDGGAMLAVNIAATLAYAGHKVVLLDCDLRNPSICDGFGLEDLGLTDYIKGDVSVDEVLQNT